MTARIPTLLRWSEEAEAAQVCALAAFERESESAAAPPIVFAAHSCPQRNRHAVLPRLLSWLGGWDPQIKRDDD